MAPKTERLFLPGTCRPAGYWYWPGRRRASRRRLAARDPGCPAVPRAGTPGGPGITPRSLAPPADVTFQGPAPWFASFQSGAFRADLLSAHPSGKAPVNKIAVELKPEQIRTKPLDLFKEAKSSVDLTQAPVIVSIGRGIKAPENISQAEALAKAIGGEMAASRPICDEGWLPMERQIGSSGQTVAPKLYLALGISGAIQHVVGMKGARTIVAINKDQNAPIFEIADYGIVGDIFELMPALTAALEKAKS